MAGAAIDRCCIPELAWQQKFWVGDRKRIKMGLMQKNFFPSRNVMEIFAVFHGYWKRHCFNIIASPNDEDKKGCLKLGFHKVGSYCNMQSALLSFSLQTLFCLNNYLGDQREKVQPVELCFRHYIVNHQFLIGVRVNCGCCQEGVPQRFAEVIQITRSPRSQ